MSVDIERLQSDVTTRLDSESIFADVNVKSLRKLVITSELDASLIVLKPKDGSSKNGLGIIVGMPTIDVPEPNVPGPMLDVLVPIRVMENPTLNQDPTNGTLMTAEAGAINVIQNLHQVGFEGFENLYAAKRAITPYSGEDVAGLVAYDCLLRATLPTAQVRAVNLPTIAIAELDPPPRFEVTLTDTTGGADMWMTFDGSCPGSKNPSAIQYVGTASVSKVPGATVIFRWCAYKAGMRGSDVGQVLLVS